MTRGYLHDLTRGGAHVGDVDSKVLRAKLRFLPWDGADFTLTGAYQQREDHAILRNVNWRGNNALALSGAYTGVLADDPWEVATDTDPVSRTRQGSVSLRGEIEAGPGTLTTTSVYVRNH